MKNKLIVYIIFGTGLLIGESDTYKILDYQYNLKKYDALRVYFDCSIGNLTMRPSNNRYIITGKIEFNSTLSKPSVNLTDKNNISRLDLKIKPGKTIRNYNSKSLINSLIKDGNDNNKINFQIEDSEDKTHWKIK